MNKPRVNIELLTNEVRKNMNGREMPFSYSYTTEKGREGYEVYKIAIPLRPNLTYEDLAEDLVSDMKKLFHRNFTPYHKQVNVEFKKWYQGEVVDAQAWNCVILFVSAKVNVPLKFNSILNGYLCNV